MEKDVCYLDNGASNHMTGNKAYFYELNEQVTGTVKFGDESCIDIRGKGSVLIEGKTGEQRLLTDVYYIPSLQCNIISLGQATEGGCEIHMKHDLLTMKDDTGKLLMKVTRTKNRLYKINLKITSPGKRAISGMKNFAGRDLQSVGLKEDKSVTSQIPIKDPSSKIQSPKKSVQETRRVVKKVIQAQGKACDDQAKQVCLLAKWSRKNIARDHEKPRENQEKSDKREVEDPSISSRKLGGESGDSGTTIAGVIVGSIVVWPKCKAQPKK